MNNPVQDGMPQWLRDIESWELLDMIESGEIDFIYQATVIQTYFNQGRNRYGEITFSKKTSPHNSSNTQLTMGKDFSSKNYAMGLSDAQASWFRKHNYSKVGFRIVRNK